MNNLSESVLDEIESTACIIVQQAVDYFSDWKAGRVYIPHPALKAMGRRYLYLRDLSGPTLLQVYEFGRLYAFFCLLYPDGQDCSIAGMAVDFCNLVNGSPSPVSLSKVHISPQIEI